MEKIELTQGRFLAIWWAFMWRFWVGVVVPAVLWRLIVFASVSFYDQWDGFVRVILWLWNVGVTFFALWVALRKTYSDFRIVPIARADKPREIATA